MKTKYTIDIVIKSTRETFTMKTYDEDEHEKALNHAEQLSKQLVNPVILSRLETGLEPNHIVFYNL